MDFNIGINPSVLEGKIPLRDQIKYVHAIIIHSWRRLMSGKGSKQELIWDVGMIVAFIGNWIFIIPGIFYRLTTMILSPAVKRWLVRQGEPTDDSVNTTEIEYDENRLYGWYSKKQDYEYGHKVYLDLEDRVTVVSEVSNGPLSDAYKWDDVVFVGELKQDGYVISTIPSLHSTYSSK